MSDRPDLAALLDAVRMHIETNVLPVIRPDPRLYFQTLVALNLLKLGQREITQGANLLRAEWSALNMLTGEEQVFPARDDEASQAIAARRAAVCKAIRSGEYDGPADSNRLAAYLEPVVTAQLALNNPGLADRMAREVAEGTAAE
jgi:hypothetical protein